MSVFAQNVFLTIADRFRHPPKNVANDDYRYFVINNYIFLYSLIGHISFAPIFYLLGDTQVFINNSICIGLDLLCFHLNFKGLIRTALFLWIVEVAAHAFFCIVAFGLGFGFEYYFLALATPAMYLRVRLRIRITVVIILFFVAAGLVLVFDGWTAPERSDLIPDWLLRLSNMVACFAGVAYIINYFSNIAHSIERKLQYQAIYDKLSGQLNRAAIIKRMHEEIERAQRTTTKLSVALIDVDQFKIINDTYGHLTGDLAIRAVAKRLQEKLRPYDLVGRYGGDEFIAILPGADTQSAAKILERLSTQNSSEMISVNDLEVEVTLSLGYTTVNHRQNPSVDDVISSADKALYRAKQSGRNRIEYTDLTDSQD